MRKSVEVLESEKLGGGRLLALSPQKVINSRSNDDIMQWTKKCQSGDES